MRIIYVHHALRDTGNPPTQNDGLKLLGIKDAEVVADILEEMGRYCNFKAIYTSPYFRCAKTAELINKKINVPIFEDARFNEFNSVFKKVNGEKLDVNGETWLDCQLRIREAIKEIVEKYDNDKKDTVICVTSGVNITAFIGVAFKIKPSDDLPFPLVPSCSPICFDIDKSYF